VGLGLTLARRLVEFHSGSIEARSPGPGRGSEFVVKLPMLARPAALPEVAAHDEARGPRRRLLIVDDNRDSAESMRLMFGHAGHDVGAVYEGEATVEAAARMKADAVLLDIGLPDIDGYEVARRLRADPRTRDALIIAVTGYGRDEDLRRSHEAGVDEHVVKPIDPDEILRRIERGRANSGSPRDRGD